MVGQGFCPNSEPMLPATLQLPAGALLIAVGLLACFAGYRLFRAVLTIYGFLLGAFFASTLVSPGDTIAMLVALVVGGLLGALIMYAGYFVGVALVGGGLGVTLTHAAWTAWRGSEPGVIVVIFAAVIGATLATTLQREIVIVATALAGAQTAVAGVVATLAARAARRAGSGRCVGGAPRDSRVRAQLAVPRVGGARHRRRDRSVPLGRLASGEEEVDDKVRPFREAALVARSVAPGSGSADLTVVLCASPVRDRLSRDGPMWRGGGRRLTLCPRIR